MSSSASSPFASPLFDTPTFGGYAAAPDALEGVSFWPRVLARMIDMVVHYITSYFAGFLFGILLIVAAKMAGHRGPLRFGSGGQFALLIASVLGLIAYHAICEGLYGSTLGKLVLSMAVVQEDGTPCRFGSAVIRSFAYAIDQLFFGVIGYTCMQKSALEQRHGDEWAQTVVCRRSQVKAESRRSAGRFVLAFLLAMMIDAVFVLTALVVKFIS
jgi:uncharacterized RDD family membrane protein YckC